VADPDRSPRTPARTIGSAPPASVAPVSPSPRPFSSR